MTTVSIDSNDRTDMREALQDGAFRVLGREVEISEPVLLAGGASKEAWSVDAGGERLLVRRAAAAVIHRHTLSLQHEFAVIEAAYEAGVKAPKPYGYIADLEGREAFVMERLEGETIGRRIVRKDELARARDVCRCSWRRSSRRSTRFRRRGCRSCRRRASSGWSTSSTRSASRIRRSSSASGGCARTARRRATPVVNHGDYRIGNVVVDEHGPRRRPRLGVRASRRSRARPRVRARARVALRRAGEAARRRRRRRAVSRALQRADRLRRAAGGARLLGARGQRRLGDRLSDAGAAAPERAGPQRRARDARPARRRGRVRDLQSAREGGAA